MAAPSTCPEDVILTGHGGRHEAGPRAGAAGAGGGGPEVAGPGATHRRATVVEGWHIERPIPGPVDQSTTARRARQSTTSRRRPAPRFHPAWAVPVRPIVEERAAPARDRTHGVPGWRPSPSPTHARHGSRRVLAGLTLATALALGVAALSAVSGGGQPATRRPEPVASVAYVVRAGDTLWTIAREIQPDGDLRPLVDALAASRHGAPLEPGDVVAWPPLPGGR